MYDFKDKRYPSLGIEWQSNIDDYSVDNGGYRESL